MRRLSLALAFTVALGAAAAVVLLALLGLQYARNDRPIVLPKPRGVHPVGRTVGQWTDRRRARDLMLFIWYPGVWARGSKHAAYIPGRWGTLAAEGYVTIPARRMEEISVAADEDIPVLPGRHPVLVLLPALGRPPAHYTTLAEDLASHGYIVAGLAPTGSTKNVVFPDGRLVEGEDDPDLTSGQVGPDLIERWIDDAEFAADAIVAAPRFAAYADRARIGIVGHSLGGAISMRLLGRDNAFRAAANLDGSPLRDMPRSPERPLLLLVGGQPPPLIGLFSRRDDEALAAICAADHAGCDLRRYDRAGQSDFTDSALLPSSFPIPAGLIGRGSIDGEQFQREIADRLLEFFARM